LLSPEARLLILAPNWLGDLVMATPLMSFLFDHLTGTGARLVLGVRPAWADLFREDPRFDSVFLIRRKDRHGGPLGSLRLGRDLAGEAFSGVVVCPPSLRMGLAVRLAGIPVRVGFPTDRRGPLLTHPVAPVSRGALHYSQEMLSLGSALVRALGLPLVETPAGPGLPAPALPSGLGGLANTETDGPPIWVLGPGATFGEAKNWPLGRVADLVRLVQARQDVRVVLLGDAQAGHQAQDLAARLKLTPRRALAGPAGLVDLTGRTDLRRVAAILGHARAYVGNDSGLMHLAGALGTPTVGVFGSSNPAWTAPLGPRAGFQAAAGFDCHPCYRKSCNQPEFCLETVTAEAVLAKLDSLMAPPARETN